MNGLARTVSNGSGSVPFFLSGESRDRLLQASIFSELGNGGVTRRIGVCGCHRDAGATTVALNLAVMLHERSGQPVALIEADLRSPSLLQHFPHPTGWGVRGFATGCAGASDALQRLPGHDGVWVMLGERVDVPTPILGATASRLAELDSRFRFVLIDLPPIIDYPDAAVMARGLDGVVLVVEAERTRWQVAREAKARLESAGLRLLGVVLNKRPRYIPEWLYRLL